MLSTISRFWLVNDGCINRLQSATRKLLGKHRDWVINKLKNAMNVLGHLVMGLNHMGGLKSFVLLHRNSFPNISTRGWGRGTKCIVYGQYGRRVNKAHLWSFVMFWKFSNCTRPLLVQFWELSKQHSCPDITKCSRVHTISCTYPITLYGNWLRWMERLNQLTVIL